MTRPGFLLFMSAAMAGLAVLCSLLGGPGALSTLLLCASFGGFGGWAEACGNRQSLREMMRCGHPSDNPSTDRALLGYLWRRLTEMTQ